jgi:signal transduction histidine kinase
MAIHIALTLSLLGSLALAGTLLQWADRVAGARLLVTFLLGVAVWIGGNELPAWAGDVAEQPALMMLATAALTSAVFLHFTLVFCRIQASPLLLAGAYGAGLAAMLTAVVVPSGRFVPFAGVARMAVPNAFGWATSAVWAVLAVLGQCVLASALRTAHGLERRRIAAVMAASGWGLFCMSGYAVAALRLPIYPWPLLGLPLFPLILVYGILRYQVLVANAWARRALAWTLLVGCGALLAGAAGAIAPLVPLPGGVWWSGVATAAAVLILGGPVRRLAQRIVYPGSAVSAEDLQRWRAALSQADTLEKLASRGSAVISHHLGLSVAVQIGAAEPYGPREANAPMLACVRDRDDWTCRLYGWDVAPPGPRRLIGLYADLLAEQAARVFGLEASRLQERQRQEQARLAELGALAASVAHDVRNPLNIIGMAVATAAPDIRAEVADQVRRIARLADDLLDYAKPWQIQTRAVDLRDTVIAATAGRTKVQLGQGLLQPLAVEADPRRIDQALANLLDNATSAGGRVAIDAECSCQALLVHVCDDGPGIPDDIRDKVFQPFVSRRTGGTGLGLAIVAKIMEAHGGSVALTDRPGWTTCFTLTLPVSQATPS